MPAQDGARSPVARARRVAGRPAPAKDADSETAHEQDADSDLAEDAPGVTDEPEKKSRAGRNLPMAIGVGVGLGALIVVSLFVYRPAFAFVVGAAVLYASWELTQAVRSAGVRIALTPLLVGGVAILIAAWERGPAGLVLALLITVLGVLVWRVADGARDYAQDTAASVLAVLYLPGLAGFAILLAHPHDGAGRVIAFVATVVCSDTGGYAAGVLFGKHPLAPVVSKGKTWEGFAGSVLACSTIGIALFTLTFHVAWWKGLLFGLAIVVTATVGDLGESMIKRDLGVKDMGTLLPGHGGIMDRLDSILPCAAVSYLVLSAFTGH